MSKAISRIVAASLAGLVLINVLACGNMQQAAQNKKLANTLKQIALMYHDYNDTNGKAPTGPQDFQQFAAEWPDGVAALQNGSVVFLYGAKITDMIEGASNTVLAYEVKVPTSGGLVVMGDGAVQTMTAQAFAAAPKAQPKAK